MKNIILLLFGPIISDKQKQGLQIITFVIALLMLSAFKLDSAQTIDASDRIPIVYESYGEGDTAVVFVHCWTCNRGFWEYQIEPVVNAGYRVVTLDLPGHGESGRDRSVWTIESLADDVAALVDALDLSRVIVVGHSMGAHVSLAAARRLSGRVKGVVTVDALHNAEFAMPEGAIEHFLGSLRTNYNETIQNFFNLFFPADTEPGIRNRIMEEIFDTDQAAAIALTEDLINLDETTLLKEAGIPVRGINSSPYSAMSIPTDIATNRKYADFDALEMEGVGHFLHMEQPDIFNRHLLDILSELSPD